jgi:hypothetical protein
MIKPDPSSDEIHAGDDIIVISASVEDDEWQEASAVARLGAYAVPVAVVHAALLYAFARAVFDFRLPAFLQTDFIVAWLWVNGAAIGLGIWLWRKGRLPIAQGKWLTGKRARWAILTWFGSSLAWFILPAILRDVWTLISSSLGDY